MRIKNIQLKNFRNYPELNLDVTNDMVVLSGPNAVGKTNLLESVYFMSLFKSFRDDADYIFMKGQTATEVKMTIDKNGEEHEIEVYLEFRDKIYANFKIDGVKKKRKEAQNFVQVVIFDPTDVDLFTKTPEARRKYLNMVLSQKSTDYLDWLSQYKRILFQKNKLLQDIRAGKSNGEGLEEWNNQLVDIGSEIIFARRGFVNFLNQTISEVYTAISQFHRPVEVFYESIPGDTLEEVKQNFTEQLAEQASRERMISSSLVGPHRDDFCLKSEGLLLPPFSSRGERRSQILALKILELEFLSTDGDKPILLLDDVLSELDDTRRTFLLRYLYGKFQTLITSTHPLEMAGQHVTLSPSTQDEEVAS
ncbi:MAG: DNA replication and repair protein RecF [Candidatus Doudnabacteria bacterium]|nr:DNA replication and repair protein RecF [Candidatus Doudnabacteria bacterium]